MSRNSDFFRVLLPWPNWGLSPNSREDWRKKADMTKAARGEARYLAMEAMQSGNYVDGDQLFAIWIFTPPDRRNRDTGNMRAAMKASQDGVFDSLLLDDRVVKDEFLHREEPRKPGGVELRLYEDYKSWLDDIIVLSSERYAGVTLLLR